MILKFIAKVRQMIKAFFRFQVFIQVNLEGMQVATSELSDGSFHR